MRIITHWKTLIPLILSLGSAAGGRLPPLVEAARKADSHVLLTVLNQGVNVNEPDADGTTALHWASYLDDVESANLLISAGARVNATNDLGASPLWAASQNGSTAMVGKLLEAGADPNIKLLLGETPLMVASRSGFPNVIKQLLTKGANVNARAARGQTALMWAVGQKHADVVQLLLNSNANIHARSEVWDQIMAVPPHGLPEYNRRILHGGNTALMFAARVGDLTSAKLLVDSGSNVNDVNAWGVSATVLAAHSGHQELVKFLLKKGADPNSAGAGFTALHEAIMRRDKKTVIALLKNGANPNIPLQEWTPIRRASRDWNFSPALVGATPFWLAARLREPNVMRLLVKHGADPLFVHYADYAVSAIAERRKEVTTPLMAAMGIGGRIRGWVEPDPIQLESLILEAAKLTIEFGVDVNAVSTEGLTALDAAMAMKHKTVVKFLLERGARSGGQ